MGLFFHPKEEEGRGLEFLREGNTVSGFGF